MKEKPQEKIKRLCSKVNGKQIKWRLLTPELNEKYSHYMNCVILASPELGVSIKPMITPKALQAIYKRYGHKKHINVFRNPSFCFVSITQKLINTRVGSQLLAILDTTEKGDISIFSGYSSSSGSHCPYS